MQRRDLSKALFASAAASTLLASPAQAQTCTAPCFARTQAEIAAGLTPVNYAIPSHEQTGGVVIPSRYFTNVVPGTTNMTTALNTLANFCRARQFTLQLEPATCLVSGTLDFSGIVVDGLGFNLDGAPHIRASAAHFDVILSAGRTVLRNVFIDGGWDGATAGQNGDGIVLRDASGGTAYDILLDNIAVFKAKKRGIYWEGAAYGRINRPQVSGCGLHALEIYSVDAPHVSTTVQITGKGALSSTPNGYGVKLTQCVEIAIDHVILESTHGIQINGTGNRSISLNHVYQEQGLGPNFLSCGNSDGIGLSITNCVGGATTIPYPTNWQNVHYSANSILTESAVPLAGRAVVSDSGEQYVSTAGGVTFTAGTLTLSPGTWLINATMQVQDAFSATVTRAGINITNNAADAGLNTSTNAGFSAGRDECNAFGPNQDGRLQAWQLYQNTTTGNVTLYLRGYLHLSAGTAAYRAHTTAVRMS